MSAPPGRWMGSASVHMLQLPVMCGLYQSLDMCTYLARSLTLHDTKTTSSCLVGGFGDSSEAVFLRSDTTLLLRAVVQIECDDPAK